MNLKDYQQSSWLNRNLISFVLIALYSPFALATFNLCTDASRKPPSVTLEIGELMRLQVEPTQAHFDQFPWRDFVGQEVTVRENHWGRGEGLKKATPQNVRVETFDYFDTHSRQAATSLQRASAPRLNGGEFVETSLWLIYTRAGNGVPYVSPIAVGYFTQVNNQQAYEDLGTLLDDIRRREGNNFVIEDLELFHTHLFEGEPFSDGDANGLKANRRGLRLGEFGDVRQRNIPPQGINFSSYVIPLSGDLIFFRTLKSSPEKYPY